MSFPKDEDNDEDVLEVDYALLLNLVFPTAVVQLAEIPQPATYEVHYLPIGGTAYRVHCVKVWEFINPVVAYNSSPIVTPGPARSASLRVGDLTRRGSGVKESGSYVPVVLCLLTRSRYFTAYRELLEGMVAYLKDLVRSVGLGPVVANTEFLRILCFLLNDAFVPPKCTKLTLQLGYKSVDFPVNYIGEPSHNEDCVLLLLEIVEVDSLVALWHCLLMERNVVVMGRKNNMIFGVLEALRTLLFPLRWAHSYIPLLTKDPFSFIADNKTILAGINTSVMSYADVAKSPMEGAVYDLDSGRLYLRPKTFDTICEVELRRLKSTLLSLKSFRHHFYEQANVPSSLAEESEPDAWKWRIMLSASDEDREDWQVSEVREAFLRPMLDNLGNYSACFAPGRKKNVPDFEVTEFSKRLTDCGSAKCRAADFWTALVHTRSFREVIDVHSTWDESDVKTFGTMVDADRTANTGNLLWQLRQNRERTPVHSITMKPDLNPKGLYIQVLKTLEQKTFSEDDNKFNTYLNRGREYVRDLMQTMRMHDYFSEHYEACITAPGYSGSEDDPRLWYGEGGLLKHLALIFECYSNEDFSELNCKEAFLQRLANDHSGAWQTLVLKAYVQEALNIDAKFAVRSYKAAYEANGGWVPFHRFALLLEATTDSQNLFQELEKTEGMLGKIAMGVWARLQDNIYEIRTRSARTSAELSPEFNPHSRTIQREMERIGRGIIRKVKRIGTVMGVMRESVSGVEIKTVPLNGRLGCRAQARDGLLIVETLLATLKKILSKYRTKIENEKTHKLIRLLEADLEFTQLYDAIGELQTCRLIPTAQQNPHQTLAFYLNLHNFMVLYAILFKKHTPNNVIEWGKFLNLVCFIVGGERVSPNAVQTILLGAPFNQSIAELATYGEIDANSEHPLQRFKLAEKLPIAHFGLYIPANFCAGLRVYTKSVEKQLEEQARVYCHTVQVDETQKKVTLPAFFRIKDFDSDGDTLKVVRKALKDDEEMKKSLKRILKSEGRQIEWQMTAEDWRFSLKKVLHEDTSHRG